MIDANEQWQLSQLSESQKLLLRLVGQGTDRSKPLAQALRRHGVELEPGTIKTYLYQAAKVLGANSRAEAAARFAAIESRLSAATVTGPAPPPSGELPGELTPDPVVPAPKTRLPRWAIAVQRLFLGLPVGGRQHTFSWWVVGLEIVRAALIGMTALTAVVLFVFGFLKAFSYPSP